MDEKEEEEEEEEGGPYLHSGTTTIHARQAEKSLQGRGRRFRDHKSIALIYNFMTSLARSA